MATPVTADDTAIIPADNRELIGQIATRATEHDRFVANANRYATRESAKLQFVARIDVAATVSLSWGDVRKALIVAAVHDLYQTLLITEGIQS